MAGHPPDEQTKTDGYGDAPLRAGGEAAEISRRGLLAIRFRPEPGATGPPPWQSPPAGDSRQNWCTNTAARTKFVRNRRAQQYFIPTNGSNFPGANTNATFKNQNIHAQIAQIWRKLSPIYHILATKNRETNSGLNQHCGSIL